MPQKKEDVRLIRTLGGRIGVQFTDEGPSDLLELFHSIDSAQYLDLVEEVVNVCEESPDRTEQVIRQLEIVFKGEDHEVREMATLVAVQLAESRPERLREFVPLLVDSLEDAPGPVADNAALALSQIASEYPSDIELAASRCGWLLDSELSFLRQRGLDIVVPVARAAPEKVVPVVPELVNLARERTCWEQPDRLDRVTSEITRREIAEASRREQIDREVQRARAILTLRLIAERRPADLVSAITPLGRLLQTETNPQAQLALMNIISLVVNTDSEAVLPVLSKLTDTIRTSCDSELQGAAIRILAALGEDHLDEVGPAVEELIPSITGLLRDDEPSTRGATAVLLTYGAEYQPEPIEPAVTDLRALLDDEHEYVRGSAIWALGLVGDDISRPVLQELSTSDPADQVRNAASEAIQMLEDR
ncbi:HEAT repeat domain-containing protein [Haladaptatus sp. CMAA 1911]|uniref:HEAT repeat domain-containing protein n=1 Tax=unclassified Haladaptatus TaxID=2622732 RepID=UPI00375530EA